MNLRKFRGAIACTLLAGVSMHLPATASTAAKTQEAVNTALVAKAFDNWKRGEGSVFDLLTEDSEWTVAGGSPVSGSYKTRAAFLEQAVSPITQRLATPITPEVQNIVAQGEHVVVIWDGTATAKDGSPYTNSYAWHLTLADGKITRVNAFLDTWKLAELMQ